MFRPIIIDPVAFQVTLVVASLLAISVWQKLKTTSGIVIAVYAIYMFSFVSANSKVKSSKPIRLASHEYKYFDNSIKADDSIKIKSSDLDKDIKISKPDDKNFDEIASKDVSNKIDTSINEILAVSPKPKTSSNDIPFKVLNMTTGTSVVNRSIVNEKNSFTTDVDRVYFLSGVQNKNDSKILFHKWYHKGRLKSKIKMESKKSYNWRSWSYITVNPNKAGDWQVVIEDQGGTRYDSLSFIINDYNI